MIPEVLPIGADALWQGWLVFLRVGAAMALLPAFGEQSVPLRVRLALGAAFALIVLPAVVPGLPARPDGTGGVALYTVIESVTGLLFGLLLRLMVLALQIAGTIAAQSTSLSQIFGGSAGTDPQPAMGHVLVIAGLALACMLGLHVRIAEYLIHGYTLIPPGTLPAGGDLARIGTAEIARCFALGFTLAAPFLIASLLYNLTLGVINRAMPQLMVAFVGAPAITAGGLALLAIAAPVLLPIWADALGRTFATPFGAP